MGSFVAGMIFLAGSWAIVHYINWWAFAIWVLLWAFTWVLGLLAEMVTGMFRR